MKKNKDVLIIGSRSVGLTLGFFLQDTCSKYYIGRGLSFERLENRCSIMHKDKGNFYFYQVKNNYKLHTKRSFDYCFLAVRDPDLYDTCEQYSEILSRAKVIICISSTQFAFDIVKNFFNNTLVARGIVMNGIQYLSPYNIYIVGKVHPLYLIIDLDKQKEVLKLFGIFREKKVEFLSFESQLKMINKKNAERYFRSFLSLLSLKYSKNLYEVLKQKKGILEGLEELSKITTIRVDYFLNLLKKVNENSDILNYYPSYSINYHLRKKTDMEWRFYFDDLRAICSNRELNFNDFIILSSLENSLNYYEEKQKAILY